MSDVLQDVSASALVTAIEANLFEIFRLFRHWPQAEVHSDPALLWTITDVPHAIFNGVLRARLAPEDLDATIEAAITRARSRGVPAMWWTGPTTRPVDLGRHLEAHGFTHAGDSRGMAIDLLTLNEGACKPPDLMISQVHDVETLKQYCRVLTIGFGGGDFVEGAWADLIGSVGLGENQPLRHYVGRLRGEPVATSSLLLAAGVAGIYNVTTIPEARRQGFGTAVTLVPLHEARALGYRIGTLQASNMGFSVYRRIGFREYCTIGHYVWKS
jgi:GNAT superfamily N-acetyltransferase